MEFRLCNTNNSGKSDDYDRYNNYITSEWLFVSLYFIHFNRLSFLLINQEISSSFNEEEKEVRQWT